jgi:transcriptional regulator with XRE-family HTH domain
MQIKTNLSAIMKAQGRTNVWLAKRINKSVNTIALWNSGKVNIPLDSVYDLAVILGVSIYDILPEKKQVINIKKHNGEIEPK